MFGGTGHGEGYSGNSADSGREQGAPSTVGDLRDVVARLSVPVDGAVLAEVLEVHDRLTACLSAVVGDVDAAELWDLDGAVNQAAWLRIKAGMTHSGGTRWAKRAARLRWLPVTRAAWETGVLSGGQVEVILAHLRDRYATRFAEHEAALIPKFAVLSVEDLKTAMGKWVEMADAVDGPDSVPPEPERTCQVARTLDDRGEVRASLDSEGRQLATTALRLAETRDGDHDPKRSRAHRRGDALVEVFRFYCDHQQTRTGGRHRPHLNIVIDLEDLEANGQGTFFDHTACDAATARRIACDAGVHRVLRSGSTILDYGRTTRTIPPATYTALAVRDGGCRFPDCDRPVAWCDGHHIWHWTDGGPTDLSNLVLLCARHHQRVHKQSWTLRLLPDATLEAVSPHDKRVLWSRPHTGPPGRARPAPAGATT